MSIKIEPQTRLSIGADAINTGLLVHERGGLELDVSAYNGLIKISSGTTSEFTTTGSDDDYAKYTATGLEGRNYAEVWSDIYGSALGASSTTAYRGDRGTTAYNHSQVAGGNSVHVSTTENTNWDTAYTHSQNNNQAHTDYLKNNASDAITGNLQIATYNYLSSLYSATDNVWGYNCIADVDDGDRLNAVSGTSTIHPQAIIMGTTGITFLTTEANPGAGADILIASYDRLVISKAGNFDFKAGNMVTTGTLGAGNATLGTVGCGVITTSGNLTITTGTGLLIAVDTYSNTTASAVNARIGNDGKIYRSTAGERKYKENITDLSTDSSKIYNLQPINFNSICKHDDKNKRFIGIVAEEAEEVLKEIIEYNDKKEPESVDYRALQVLMLAEIQQLNQRIIKLESK